MASLAMAPSMMVLSGSPTCASVVSRDFSSTSSVKMTSTTSFAAPLRVSGASRNLYVVAMASPQGGQSSTTKGELENAIDDATEVCAADETSGNCAAAWDNVEELAAHAAHMKTAKEDANSQDPLEQFCKETPEADECRVYED